jgi:hypothetical protein
MVSLLIFVVTKSIPCLFSTSSTFSRVSPRCSSFIQFFSDIFSVRQISSMIRFLIRSHSLHHFYLGIVTMDKLSSAFPAPRSRSEEPGACPFLNNRLSNWASDANTLNISSSGRRRGVNRSVANRSESHPPLFAVHPPNLQGETSSDRADPISRQGKYLLLSLPDAHVESRSVRFTAHYLYR